MKGAEKTAAQEPEEGKKKKKDRKRKHSCEEDGDEEQNGADNKTSSKKTKTSKAFSKEMLFSLQCYMILFLCIVIYSVSSLCLLMNSDMTMRKVCLATKSR